MLLSSSQESPDQNPVACTLYHLLFKGCLRILLPTITRIINLSLSAATMPDVFKTAVLSPLLKKPDADHNQFSNFRPVSNLKLVSNLVDKVVASQLINFVSRHDLDEM